MKSVTFVAFFMAIISISCASTKLQNFNNPKYPGKCTMNNKLILSPGESIKNPVAKCGRVSCLAGSLVEFTYCGTKQPPAGCRFGDYIDDKLQFPECCEKKLIC